MTRKRPTSDEKVAALVLTMMVEEDGKLVPFLDREIAKQMTAAQIASLVEWDHYPIPVALGGGNHPTNLVARPILEHRTKTAKIDVPTIAKTNRISAAHEDFRRNVLRRAGQEESADEAPKRKTKAVIQGSRNSPWKRKINGRVERR